jgi:coproporphyrinogen III oxidase-like Fe-S oxidoreductase
LAAGSLPVAGEESLDATTASLERTWLGLRISEGLDAATLSDRQWALAAEWTRQGWARMPDGRVQLTAEGWLLLDRLAVELDDAGPGTPRSA